MTTRGDRDDPDAWIERAYRPPEREFGYDGQRGDAFAAWQERARRELRTVLGFDAIDAGAASDLEPRRLETASKDGYERQTWTVRTEPGVRVPCYLLLPDDVDPPYPVVLTIHGHVPTDAGKALPAGEYGGGEAAEIVDERRDIAVQAARRGYAALAPDVRGFGDLAHPEASDDGVDACTRLGKLARLAGRTLAGDRTWDVLRLVDFVESRPDLDGDRIAITGHSGGGAVTLFAGALEDRLSPVVPNAYVCTLEDSIVAIEHCACNYVSGLRRFGEMWDIAGLAAPRPFLVSTGADDPIFPLEGTERAFSNLRQIYRAAGAEDACALHVGDGGHRFYPDGVWPFVEEHL